MSGGPAAQDYSSASCIWRTDVQKAASSVPSPVEAPDQTARAGYRAPWEEHTQREHTQREPKLELRLGGLQEPARSPWGGICPAAPCFVCPLSQHSRKQRNRAGAAFKVPVGRLSACGRMLFPPGLSHPKCQGLIKQLCPLPAH